MNNEFQCATCCRFEYQSQLPSLPVPALEATVAKYVENARLFLSPQELERTRQEAERFLQGPGPVLQQKLLERADLKKKENKSWLIDWWNRCARAVRSVCVCVCACAV